MIKDQLIRESELQNKALQEEASYFAKDELGARIITSGKVEPIPNTEDDWGEMTNEELER